MKPNQLASEVTVGDYLKDGDSGTGSEYGEVVRSTQNTVTVFWDNGEQEQILRDLLDHPAFDVIEDSEVPPPEEFLEMLKEHYPELL